MILTPCPCFPALQNSLIPGGLTWEEMLYPLYQKYKNYITWGDQDLLNIIFYFNPGKEWFSESSLSELRKHLELDFFFKLLFVIYNMYKYSGMELLYNCILKGFITCENISDIAAGNGAWTCSLNM